MTPCEEKGYEVGQVFEIQGDGNFSVDCGDLVVLEIDDGSSAPWFHVIVGENRGTEVCRTITNDRIKRIYPPEELSKDVEITCEGKTVTISRESAIALNLIKE